MRNKFEVTGLFYQQGDFKCRKYLDIKRVDSLQALPDVMVVMMNPGSSYPLDSIDNNMVASPAVPDKTQDQIMKIMDNLNFDYARILNLSDLRTPKSNELYKFIKSSQSETFPHSIFDGKRKEELKSLFVQGVPVIYGWGVNKALEPLAKLAIEAINCSDPVGLKKAETLHSYYHPLPQVYKDQVEWVKVVTEQLNRK
ncbi:hypothetical protein A9264_14415 [Vibrio sp. UCD-FRSSP16_10]|uniref:DUF1643 domain-containing protein n=1 Tax=unclassified Vibrio TaxID=2614977 RepID=UPI0007FEF6B2|nr:MULTISPECIES: DUF1643 domain-containing protein [unclassified Vibrio]OBT13158.1 hypothetical protein A9260_14795 [Vibrio sp. UCD-FRSSP16_30]OBT19559.1 hypothetical protein A9264_14415 [Vibrio sp. UCD-FRSSP16_10]